MLTGTRALRTDAILTTLLGLREEEGEEQRRYVREAFYRRDLGVPQVKPNVWFKAPAEWAAPDPAEKVHEGLEDGTTGNNSGEADSQPLKEGK